MSSEKQPKQIYYYYTDTQVQLCREACTHVLDLCFLFPRACLLPISLHIALKSIGYDISYLYLIDSQTLPHLNPS